MSNKFIYPILIIIFSVLIIFAILNRRNNQRLNNNIEKFMNLSSALDGESQDLTFNITNNTEITVNRFANGNWTTPPTNFYEFPANYDYCACYWECVSTDNNGNCTSWIPTAYWSTNYMTINITDTMENNPSATYYGTIFNPIGSRDTYNITYVLNETITGVSQSNPNLHIQIKFLNFYTGETYSALQNAIDTFTSVVTVFSVDTIISKYESFKLTQNGCVNCYCDEYDSACSGDNPDTNYNLISAQTYNINLNQSIGMDTGNSTANPAEVYDINAYQIITSPNYKYPSNFITLSFGQSPSPSTLNNIQTNYGGNINLSIQRQFLSPTGAIITSVMSNLLSLPVLQNGQIPQTIIISSFQSDMQANNLETFFQPYSTNLFIQLLVSSNPSYGYSDSNMINVSNLNFNLQNNADSMYQPNVQFPDLNSLTQTNNKTYQLKLIGNYQPEGDLMTGQTLVSFGVLGL